MVINQQDINREIKRIGFYYKKGMLSKHQVKSLKGQLLNGKFHEAVNGIDNTIKRNVQKEAALGDSIG